MDDRGHASSFASASASAGIALCVLGCRPSSAAFARRVAAGAVAFREGRGSIVVACGGRAWRHDGDVAVEADVMARELEAHGVPRSAIVRERCSLDTRDNARFAAAMLARRGVGRVLVVTCAWHLPRATRLFDRAGLEVEGLGVPRPDTGRVTGLVLHVRETLSWWKDARKPVKVG